MSEENNEPSDEVVAEAREMGWVSQEEFRGDKAKWTDAETFVKRGRENLPILNKNYKRLLGDVSGMKNTISRLTSALSESREAIEALKEHNSAANRQALVESKSAITARLVQARKDGDVEAEVQLQEQLTDTTVALREADKEPDVIPPKKDNGPPKLAPEFEAWQQENIDWFGINTRKTSMAIAIAQELQAENPGLKGTKFYAKVDEELAKVFPDNTRRNNASKVGNGDLGGSDNGSGEGGGKSYSDLPADARAACQKQASRLVGPNKAYKDLQSWQKAYTATYFGMES